MRAMWVGCVVWSAACGGLQPRPMDLVIADPTPDPLPQLRLPVSAGPILDAAVCSAELDRMIATLTAYEASARPAGAAADASMFLHVDDRAGCAAALASLRAAAGCTTASAAQLQQALVLNECVLAAVADPERGATLVQVALGRGVLGHAAGAASCASEPATVAATLARLGPKTSSGTGNALLDLLDKDVRPRCAAAVTALTAAPAPACTAVPAFTLDACLVELRRVGTAGERIVDALVGTGVVTRDPGRCSEWTSSLQAPSLATALVLPGAPTPRLDHASASTRCTAHVGQLAASQCTAATASDLRLVDVCTVAQAVGFPRAGRSKTAAEYELRLDALPVTVVGGAPIAAQAPVVAPLAASSALPSQAALINGLADFLVSRAKEEVQQSLAKDFVAKICRRTWDGVAVQTYFPQTCKLLQGRFLSDGVSLRSFGSAAQRAIENDLLGLLPALLNAARGKAPLGVAAFAAVAPELARKPLDADAIVAALAGAMPCTSTLAGPRPTAGEVGCGLRLAGLLYAHADPASAIASDAALQAWLAPYAGVVAGLVAQASQLTGDGAPRFAAVLALVARAIVAGNLATVPGATDLARALDALRVAVARYSPAIETVIGAVPHLLRTPRDLPAFFAALAASACTASGDGEVSSIDAELGCAMHVVGVIGAHLGTGAGDPAAAARKAIADPVVATWIQNRAKGRLPGLAAEMATLIADADRIEAFDVIERLVGALHHNLNNTIVIAALEARLGPLRERFTGVGRLAYVLYYAGRALLDGENPAPTIVTATQQLQCAWDPRTPQTGDLPCALALTGATLGVFLETSARWSGSAPTGAQLARYLQEVEQRVERVVIARSDRLAAWVAHRFGALANARLSSHSLQDIRAFSTALFRAVTSFSKLLDENPASLANPDGTPVPAALARVEQRLTAGTIFFRAVIENSVLDPDVRKRALRVLDHSNALVSAMVHRNIAAFVAELYALAEDLGMPEPLPASMRKYVPLVTALAGAKTAGEVKAAIEKYAAEPGGYAKKRAPGMHFSLSGYVGFAGGIERGFDSDTIGAAGSTGLYLPVGLDVTWGGCRACGLFASIVDLGAVASIRLEGGDAQATEHVTWSQVVSPGIGARVALGGPVVLGVSGSISPEIRQDAGNQDHTIWRVLGFVAIDVTILPF